MQLGYLYSAGLPPAHGMVLPTVSWAPDINQPPRRFPIDMPVGQSDLGNTELKLPLK